MAFDECTPFPCDYAYAERSMKLTHEWLKRCINQMEGSSSKYGHSQSLFPIVQGRVYADLGKQSAEEISAHGQDGNAIGGLAVGEPIEVMYELTELVCSILPENRPRYLMGVGTPANILESIALGVDMFDCVMPTRNGRNGMLFTTQGIINIKNKKWKNDQSPIDQELGGYVSTNYSKAYLRHLITSNEILGLQISSIQNLTFYLWLVRCAREKINQGIFLDWKNKMVEIVSRRL